MAAAGRSALVGVFEDRDQADRAVDELRRTGFRDDEMVLRAPKGGLLQTILSDGAASARDLLSTLVGLGVPEEEARHYERELEAGRIIVAVRADGGYEEAAAILRRYGHTIGTSSE